MSRGKLLGRRVDWLIHQLVGDVVNRYDFMTFRKENGFVSNKKDRSLALSAIVRARSIPDTNVQLPTTPDRSALVRSCNRPWLQYRVLNPSSEWAVCECVHSQKGNICKHQVKVLQMLNPEIAEGKIARVLGSLHGTTQGGVSRLLDFQGFPSPDRDPVETQQPTPERPELGEEYEGDDDLMCQLLIKLAERATRFPVIMRHFVADLRAADTRHARMEVQIMNGQLHPSQQASEPFTRLEDGLNNSLNRLRDFIDVRGFRVRRVRARVQ